MSEPAADWRRDRRFRSFEERLKHTLVPAKLYMRNLAYRRMRKGEKELHVLHALVDCGRVSIDIGANKGAYTYHLSRLSRDVMAFEPNPKIYGILRDGAPANVRTFEVALSNKDGPAELILPVQRTGKFSNQGATLQPLKLNSKKDFGVYPIQQKRLDGYGFEDVAFMKIDVEGFEFEVIEGAQETLRREKPVLLIEIDPNQNRRPLSDAIEMVKAYGYDCFYMSRTSLRHFSAFESDRTKSPTNNFIFFPM